VTPAASERSLLGLNRNARKKILRAVGCAACSGTGYAGRTAIFEALAVDATIRPRLAASADDLHAAAVENGMRTLFEDGLRLVLDGTTSLDEIRRVTGDPAFHHAARAIAR